MSEEKVNHPAHYNQNSIGLEVIDIIALLTDRASFDIGNAIKYICRAPYKKDAPFIEHLNKALWYLEDLKRKCNFPGPIKLTPFEHTVLNKFERTFLEGNEEEVICGKILGKLHVDICYHYSITDTITFLENQIIALKEQDSDRHKKGTE